MDNFRQRLCFSTPTAVDVLLDREMNNVRCVFLCSFLLCIFCTLYIYVLLKYIIIFRNIKT